MAMGPRAVVVKRGEYGAAMFTGDGFFALPAFPLEEVTDPTGAGDSFAGGFMGYLSALEGDAALDDANLRRAMTYGSVLASFNVEEFGTERVARLERDEIDARFEQFRQITALEGDAALDDANLRRAMTYGSVLASFNVEEFGTERVSRLSRDEIDERYAELKDMTALDGVPTT